MYRIIHPSLSERSSISLSHPATNGSGSQRPELLVVGFTTQKVIRGRLSLRRARSATSACTRREVSVQILVTRFSSSPLSAHTRYWLPVSKSNPQSNSHGPRSLATITVQNPQGNCAMLIQSARRRSLSWCSNGPGHRFLLFHRAFKNNLARVRSVATPLRHLSHRFRSARCSARAGLCIPGDEREDRITPPHRTGI
jgi:hypothetical protein